MNRTCVLLATYNGEIYLPKLIDSLLIQTYSSFDILVHDDGSTDNTQLILKEYQTKYPRKIFILNDNEVFHNPCKNFLFLTKHANQYRYVYFCDQDDIWNARKMEIYASTFKRLENLYSRNKPILLHSDLETIDEDDQILLPSLNEYQRNRKQQVNIKSAYYKNYVTGCTIAINKPLVLLIDLNSQNILMHDWWISLSALKSNSIHYYINLPLVSYRQHKNNFCGMRTSKKITMTYNFLAYFQGLFTNLAKTYKQCRELERVDPITFAVNYIANKLY